MNSKEVALKAFIQASMFALVILLILLLLNASQVLLIVYAGILLAVLYHGFAEWIARKIGISEKFTLAVAILAPLIGLGVGIWLMAPSIGDQANELAERLPEAVGELKQQLLQYEWASRFWENKERMQEFLPEPSDSAPIVSSFFSSTLGVLGNFIVIFFIGLFLSINPKLYVNGTIQLLPVCKRSRARHILKTTGAILQSWLIAKLAAMAVIGVLTATGLWLLGIDLALVLGLIAAILSFIPNFGPIASVIPAVLVALIDSSEKAFYVLLLYIGVQAIESYVVTPILQQKMVDLPPAILITMQILFGVIAGMWGVILATPLTIAMMVLINMWYIEDVLNDKKEGM